MATILIAEDDDNIRLLMEKQLEKQHLTISTANGVEAWNEFSDKDVDLLVVDIMMPGMDGFSLIEKIREAGSSIPILIITANQTFDSKKKGFSLGTDDYLTKPFELEELTWRVQALLKRTKIVDDQQVKEGGFILDTLSQTLSKEERTVALPKKEFDLLHKLLSYPGRIYTKDQLLDSIWGYSTESSDDTIKTHMSRLRGKLSDFPELTLKAVKGIGYKLIIQKEQDET